MDFGWSDEQSREYNRILEATREHFSEPCEGFWTREQWRKVGELGLLGLSVPKEYGGSGYDALTTARLYEAFGRGSADLGIVFSAAAHLFACAMPIVEHGSEDLKQALLPKMCSGEWVATNAITEVDAGSDVSKVATVAKKGDDGYRITGEKNYASNSPVADVFVIYATTNPAFGALGATAFALTKRDGLTAPPAFDKMGVHSCPGGHVVLEDVQAGKSELIGREGQGALIFQDSMQWERACLFAGYTGMMDALLGKCVEHAKTRKQFGQPLGKFQAISHKIADMKLRLEASRLLLYKACWSFQHGERSVIDVAMSKIAVSEAAVQAGLDAITVFGGAGYKTATGIESALRDAIPARIFSGTNEIQKELIAKELGL